MSTRVAAAGSVIPNISLSVYQVKLVPQKEHQTILGAVIVFTCEPGTERARAREIARKLPLTGSS